MINIRQEVVNKLTYLYPDIPIHDETPQEFVEPYFLVNLLESTQSREINNRYKRVYSFDIQYIAETNYECEVLADKLYEDMEYLLNNYAKGLKMRHEIVDKVLHFFVEYNIRLVREKEEVPKLNNLEVNEYGI